LTCLALGNAATNAVFYSTRQTDACSYVGITPSYQSINHAISNVLEKYDHVHVVCLCMKIGQFNFAFEIISQPSNNSEVVTRIIVTRCMCHQSTDQSAMALILRHCLKICYFALCQHGRVVSYLSECLYFISIFDFDSLVTLLDHYRITNHPSISASSFIIVVMSLEKRVSEYYDEAIKPPNAKHLREMKALQKFM
jgi:hypothetical protein